MIIWDGNLIMIYFVIIKLMKFVNNICEDVIENCWLFLV